MENLHSSIPHITMKEIFNKICFKIVYPIEDNFPGTYKDFFCWNLYRLLNNSVMKEQKLNNKETLINQEITGEY